MTDREHGRCGCGSRGGRESDDPRAPESAFDRRRFLAGAGSAALLAGLPALPVVAGPFSAQDIPDHYVPLDKKLDPGWIRRLFERGESTWYAGSDLATIGMPVGGICAGQLYLSGDGRLVDWGIFNQQVNTGYGATNYAVGRGAEETVRNQAVTAAPEVDQGFAIRVVAGGTTAERTLDGRGFPDVRFCGEYPIARLEMADEDFPVRIDLEAYSPFVPLEAEASSLPATVMRYTLRNTSGGEVEVTLAGWLENAVARYSEEQFADELRRRNEAIAGDGMRALLARAEQVEVERPPERAPTVLADFEGESYGGWEVEGIVFGDRPAHGTLTDQLEVTGFDGEGLVNTYLGGDGGTGTLRSPPFVVDRPVLSFLIGGGSHEGETAVNLIVDGEVVRTATGADSERLVPHNWDVVELAGREARIEIVDAHSGGWGHVNVDQIELRDSPRRPDLGDLPQRPDFGTLCLAVIGDGAVVSRLPAGASPSTVLDLDARPEPESAGTPGVRPRGAVGRRSRLEPGESAEVVFVLAWHMPNLYRNDTWVGNRYATRFADAADVARHVVADLDELTAATRLWHDTWYDSTLPWWLLDRLHSTVANLATETCQWWADGRFWGWEGVGCCHGTCGHVWNYAHAMARLFPDLERSVREMQDFDPDAGFDPNTGAIAFRGIRPGLWAGDAQGGYLLKALREHQTGTDDTFLRRNWPRIRKAVQFLIGEDGNADGILEGAQHQTYDEFYWGANTMVGSLYLGALRAAEEMAREMGDPTFAARCRRIFDAGRDHSVERLFNGEYYIQDVDLHEHPDAQYADGCLADQMFGQGWAHQVGLGYLYPPATVRSALQSVWDYCWAPDVGPQNAAHSPERWFAHPGEAGLFTCTWPKSRHLGPESTRYRNEIWTGIEYQVAGHMAWEGMLTEALAICRGIHERYHPSKHNPFNEIECGDHYARAMASWGVLIGLSGFEYRGPDGHVGFAPRITPERFRCAFTAADGWGTLDQRRDRRGQTSEVRVVHGRLRVRSVAVDAASDARARVRVTVDGEPRDATASQSGRRVVVTLASPVSVAAGGALRVELDGARS